MVIPSENKLVRLYIQLNEVNSAGQQLERAKITPKIILKAAQRIISPYELAYDYCDWWTAYQIGQRVGNSFSCDDRVFLAGDAVHTHSPKAGQGMNVSMQDPYNQSDARPWHFGQLLRSDGGFRIVVFAGNLKDGKQWERLKGFGESLATPDSVIRGFTPFAKPLDSVIEILVIHLSPRQEVELLDLHEMFRPFDER